MDSAKNTSSKKTGKSSVSDGMSDYKYNPRVETPNPKAESNKLSDKGSK